MKKIDLFFVLILCVVSFGCKTTTVKDDRASSGLIKLELVELGDAKLVVEHKIGKASEHRKSLKDELWIYDDEANNTQMGTLTFNSETQLVKGITFVPSLESKESKIDFLMKQKFPEIKFEEIIPNRCQKDFLSTSMFYVNRKQGIIIRYNPHSQIVESYSKVVNTYTDELVKSITSCP